MAVSIWIDDLLDFLLFNQLLSSMFLFEYLFSLLVNVSEPNEMQ